MVTKVTAKGPKEEEEAKSGEAIEIDPNSSGDGSTTITPMMQDIIDEFK